MKLNLSKLIFSVFAGAMFLLLGFFHAKAATLYINPGSGNFSVGSSFTVTVRTDTEGQAVNTAEANISFSQDTLELVQVSASRVFYLQAPGSPSKGVNSAYFGGGLPTPGYTGNNGIVGSMVFRARQQGTASISITGGKVLLNDGSGTNALTSTRGATYTISPAPVAGPEVTSPTHPDPDKWYSKKDLTVSWSRPKSGFGFSFEIDQNDDTVPDNVLDTTVTTAKNYPGLADGGWYFHIKSRGQALGSAFSATVHFRVQIDTVPPKPFEIKVVGEDDLKNVSQTPTLEFATVDEFSGIDRYEILVENRLVDTTAHNPYTFKEKLEAGPHLLKVVAFDKAENSQSASSAVIIGGEKAVSISFLWWIPFLFALNILMLALIIILLWVLFYRRRKELYPADERIRALKLEIDQTLIKLKKQIDNKLLKILRRPTGEGKGNIAQEINEDISKTKRKIDKVIQ